MRFTSRKWAVSTIAALGLTTIAAAAGIFGLAAAYQYRIGTISFCFVSGTLLAIQQETACFIPFEGRAGFETVNNSESPTSTTLKAISFEGTGYAPEAGEVTLELASTGPLSTITGTGASPTGGGFPASSILTFDAKFTLSSQPGAVYTGEITVTNPDIIEWPHNETKYEQAGTATLTHTTDPLKSIEVSEIVVSVTEQ